MQLKTILNRVQKFKSFVYKSERWTGSTEVPELETEVVERANSWPMCSGCRSPGAGYDRQPKRRFEFVPLWGIKIFFVYAPRRVDCARCGVKVEQMPWALGKRPLTQAWLVSVRLGQAAMLEGGGRGFYSSWDSVFRSVEMAIDWGRAHQGLSGVQKPCDARLSR